MAKEEVAERKQTSAPQTKGSRKKVREHGVASLDAILGTGKFAPPAYQVSASNRSGAERRIYFMERIGGSSD